MAKENKQEIRHNTGTGLWGSRYWLPSVTGRTDVFSYDEDEDGLKVQRVQEPYKGYWALLGG